MGEAAEEPSDLLERASRGCATALDEVFARHRARLLRMVRMRLDRRLQGRLAPSDVLQEAYLEFARCLADYLRNPALPFFLWLRHLTGMKLHALHRKHLGTRMRDARREVALPDASSASLADHLLSRGRSPSEEAIRAELQRHVREALDRMEPLDREVLVLRHFEQLSNGETAQVLGLSEAAASNRFVRALKRLKQILQGSDAP